MSEGTASTPEISKEDGTDNMTVFLLSLIVLMIWLISCAVCGAIGFFCARKFCVKKATEPKKLTPEQERLQQKKAREELNFYSYDGSVQDGFNT